MTDYIETMKARKTCVETLEDVSQMALDMEHGLEMISKLCEDDGYSIELTGKEISGLMRILKDTAHRIQRMVDYAWEQATKKEAAA